MLSAHVILSGLISVVQHVAKLEQSFSRAAGKAVSFRATGHPQDSDQHEMNRL